MAEVAGVGVVCGGWCRGEGEWVGVVEVDVDVDVDGVNERVKMIPE